MLTAEITLIVAANEALSQPRSERVAEAVAACPSPDGLLTYQWVGDILAQAMTPAPASPASILMQMREVDLTEDGVTRSLDECSPEAIAAVSALLLPTLSMSVVMGLKWAVEPDSRPAGLNDMMWEVGESYGLIGATANFFLEGGRTLVVKYGHLISNGSARIETLSWEPLTVLTARCVSLSGETGADPTLIAEQAAAAAAAAAAVRDGREDDDDDEDLAPGGEPSAPAPQSIH